MVSRIELPLDCYGEVIYVRVDSGHCRDEPPNFVIGAKLVPKNRGVAHDHSATGEGISSGVFIYNSHRLSCASNRYLGQS